jgi:heat shock protein HtpX
MNLASYKAGNNIKTFLLIAALTALLLAIGFLIGGASGIIVFAVIAVIFNFAMYWFSGKFALKMSRAVEVSEAEEPELHRMIATLAARAGVPKPGVYVTPAEQPNAFATGRNPKHAAVAVTQGLRKYLPEDQIRGVLAHEFAHIKNRDMLVTTIAAMIGAAIAAIANFLQFSFLFGGGDDNDSPLGFVGALAAILIAPMAAMLLQLAVSRQREYLADATAAELLGEGRPLASALESLKRGVQAIPMQVNPATEALYIANPLSGRGMTALFSTHPPLDERIRKLREWDAKRGIHYGY